MQNTSSFKSAYADVNGIKMYYEIHGAGFPLVLIHGGGSTIQTSFRNIIPLLAKTHQVIAVELQAHGRTSDRDAPETFEQDAADVAELLRQLNIPTADILGFSNGGQTAMQLAMNRPEKIRKLIIASAFYKKEGVPVPFWQAMDKATFADMPQVYKDEFLKVNNDPTALLNMFNRDAQRMRTFKDWNDSDLRSIKAKTLVIAGDRDVALNVHSAVMAGLIPNCQLAILPGGHGTYLGEIAMLVNGEWTQRYAVELIEQFLLGN
ncbi:MAG: alpha/beta hydrolase fold protein [Bacteroidetes bacterium]|nr:alpha/beta hydrolase fold protein [Bacteroidota bacterium]